MHLDFMLNQVACFHGSQILWFQMQWLFSSKQTNLSIEEEPGKGPVPRNVVIAVTNTLKSAFLVNDDTEASSWARPALTTSPPHLSREVRLQTGWKYHAVPKLMPKLSQERIFAPFAEYNCTEYSCGMAQASSRRQGAGPSLSDWSDTISNLIEAENKKMTADCCSHQYT